MSVPATTGIPGLAGTNPPTLLELRGIVQRFGASPGRLAQRLGLARAPHAVLAVDRVDLDIARAEVVGLAGESGCGKSTLARIAAGTLRPSEGTRRWNGRDIAALEGSERIVAELAIQLVFQDAHAALDPRMRVIDQLCEAPVAHRRVDASVAGALGERLLDEVGLDPALGRRYPHQLSGGQRQRVAIARALAVDPQLLVCDEPVSALDMTVQAQILDLLGRIRRERGLALLFIGHDLEAVGAVSERIAVMKDGRVIEIGTAAAVLQRPVTAYAQALVGAMPYRLARPGGVVEALAIAGT
jgi:peptide/nickel transport system ATP-binding protein